MAQVKNIGNHAIAANNGSWLQKGLDYLKNHPVFISVNEIVAGAGGPPFLLLPDTTTEEGAPSLRSLQGWESVLPAPGDFPDMKLGLTRE
jgi:hypothetical protein